MGSRARDVRSRRVLRTVLATIAIGLSAGCSSAERVERHEGWIPDAWPLEWRGYSLFESDGRYAYATGAGAAESTCAFVAEIEEAFRERTGEEPGRSLVLAIDAGDAYPIEPLRETLPPLLEETGVRTGAKSRLRLEALDEELAELGVTLETMVTLIPIVARPAAFDPELDAQDGGPAWILLSTRDRMDDAIDTLIDAGLEREKVGLGKRILLAPMRPMVRRTLRGKFEDQIRRSLFAQQVRAIEDWTPERQRRSIEEYEIELGLRSRIIEGTIDRSAPEAVGDASAPADSTAEGDPTPQLPAP